MITFSQSFWAIYSPSLEMFVCISHDSGGYPYTSKFPKIGDFRNKEIVQDYFNSFKEKNFYTKADDFQIVLIGFNLLKG